MAPVSFKEKFHIKSQNCDNLISTYYLMKIIHSIDISITAGFLKQFTIGVGNEFNATDFSSLNTSTFNECLYHEGENSRLMKYCIILMGFN